MKKLLIKIVCLLASVMFLASGCSVNKVKANAERVFEDIYHEVSSLVGKENHLSIETVVGPKEQADPNEQVVENQWKETVKNVAEWLKVCGKIIIQAIRTVNVRLVSVNPIGKTATYRITVPDVIRFITEMIAGSGTAAKTGDRIRQMSELGGFPYIEHDIEVPAEVNVVEEPERYCSAL